MDALEAADRLFDSLRLMRLRFEVESTSRFWLPDWPGSMLRGALGTCLKALEDETGGTEYDGLYRARRALDGRAGDSETDTPRPYMIEWEPGGGRVLQRGDGFTFDVILLGRAIEHAVSVIASVSRAADEGLGTDRVPHRLVTARVLEGGASGVRLRDAPDPLPARLAPSLTLRATTPLLLNRDPALARRPTAEMMFVAALRRLRQLVAAHGEAPISPYRIENDLRGHLGGVRLDTSRMRWVATERDSRTASRKIPLGGLVGPFTLEGDLEPLRALLRAMLVLHVGRQVSQGQGAIGMGVREAPTHATSSPPRASAHRELMKLSTTAT